ncbi:MAG: dipeptidase [Chlamydiota bacterium]
MMRIAALTILISLLSFSQHLFCCTTILITKGATSDGSCFVAHSDDNELGDQRIVYVPAADHSPGSKRPIYPYGEHYPRLVSKRAPAYALADHHETSPTAYIDQVNHTYAYFDGNYAIMNEKQLAIGECTNASKWQLDYDPSLRKIEISELSRIALERCDNARDAITVIGKLAEELGYYGWGETLLIADKTEGWVFEISSSPTGTSALWVAKKVPDGEVFVAANEFRIREIDPDDKDMMYSSTLYDIAQQQGWWSPDNSKKLDWLPSTSPGEYNHPYYSLRRVWRLQSRINPTLNLSPWVEGGYTRAYPFSIKPHKKLTVKDVMDLYRDHYEGTPFDMTKGIAAGPFASPNRYIGSYDIRSTRSSFTSPKIAGSWERPISIFYCGYSYINQIRDWLPDPIGGVVWYGPDAPINTCYVPFYIGMTDLPTPYQSGSSKDFNFKTAWWAFNFVGNWMQLKYSYMIEDIKNVQSEIEPKEILMQTAIDQGALALYHQDQELAKEYLTTYCTDNSEKIVARWWHLAKYLIEKYSDGYLNKPNLSQEIGYPLDWLKVSGYYEGPTQYENPK